jgi:hypothetical protein
MFDNRDDPKLLQDSLEKIVDRWFGHRRPWYGVDAEKLEHTQLPEPLKWLYGYAGYWPSRNWHEHLFGTQDAILPFECLTRANDKLIFGSENQGGWSVATLAGGEDPPVWVSFDEVPDWTLLCDSLMQFLVTFCLRETIFGSCRMASGDDLITEFKEHGDHVAPLWLNGPYVGGENECRSIDFYLINSHVLSTNYWCGWCGGAFLNDPAPEYPFIDWKGKDKLSRMPYSFYEPIPDGLPIPQVMKIQHYRTLIHRHEEQAQHHLEMVRKYTAILLNKYTRNEE